MAKRALNREGAIWRKIPTRIRMNDRLGQSKVKRRARLSVGGFSHKARRSREFGKGKKVKARGDCTDLASLLVAEKNLGVALRFRVCSNRDCLGI